MAEVAAGTLNCSAAYLSTAVKGASSGTLSLTRHLDREIKSKSHLHFEGQFRVGRQSNFKFDLGLSGGRHLYLSS